MSTAKCVTPTERVQCGPSDLSDAVRALNRKIEATLLIGSEAMDETIRRVNARFAAEREFSTRGREAIAPRALWVADPVPWRNVVWTYLAREFVKLEPRAAEVTVSATLADGTVIKTDQQLRKLFGSTAPVGLFPLGREFKGGLKQ